MFEIDDSISGWPFGGGGMGIDGSGSGRFKNSVCVGILIFSCIKTPYFIITSNNLKILYY